MEEKTKKEYNGLFYEAEFSSYDFIILFVAINLKEGNLEFNQDALINFIALCKEKKIYVPILSEVSLVSNGNNLYSVEIMAAINQLKWAKILYSESSEEETIYIADGNYYEELMMSREKYVLEMTDFCHEFQQNTLILKKEK